MKTSNVWSLQYGPAAAGRASLEMMPVAPPAQELHSYVPSEETAAHRPVQPPGIIYHKSPEPHSPQFIDASSRSSASSFFRRSR